MYTVTRAARISRPSFDQRTLEGRRRTLVVGDHAGGQFLLGDDFVDGIEGLRRASSCPPRLKEIVTTGNCPWWLIDSGSLCVCDVGKGAEGNRGWRRVRWRSAPRSPTTAMPRAGRRPRGSVQRSRCAGEIGVLSMLAARQDRRAC